MNSVQKITKNIGITGISQIILAISSFILMIYIARYFGTSEFGEYNFAISFTMLFSIITDLGISQMIIREIARDKDSTNKYMSNALIIKLVMSIVTIGLIAVTINLLNYPPLMVTIVYLFGIYTIFTSFSQTFVSVFQAFEKMEYSNLILILGNIILIPIAFYVLLNNYGLIQLAYVYVLSGFFNALLGFFIFRQKITKLTISLDLNFCKKMIIESLPFGLNAIFANFFFRFDTILLSIIKDNYAVGIYAAAYNPLLALGNILTNMFATTIYPVMSRYYVHSEDSLKRMAIMSSKYMIIIGLPITIGCLVLSKQLIELFYGIKYFDSILAFQILTFFIPIRLISNITGTLLTSINKQKIRTFCVFLSVIFNIISNLILIPYFSFLGASIATVLSELFLYVSFLYFTNKYYHNIIVIKNFVNPIIASFIMGGFAFYFKTFSIILIIFASSIIYFLILILLGTFKSEDDKFIINQLKEVRK
ncbi:polysaccharide biosynthesis protein [Methanobacterium lacus]|uniref:Polysaccharide biosynthesis protein n=1 Tax=Methanobacterium lacus (strain AL-21) TaxID=877455 RepID=F0TBN7_METLA|nr:flippase [Methanobacterium lacus]ADZ09114.1 polysaccharide biosynthesis protein [Methanobacterium lacus]